jgi:hypothetical protein
MEQLSLGKLIKHYDKWYKQLLYLKEHNVMRSNGEIVMEALAAWRDYCGADHVLRDQTGFMLCETIEDALIIEETIAVNTTDNHV